MKRESPDQGPDLTLVGRITGCFGIRGFLKLELAGRSPERAKSLGRVFIGRSPAEAAPHTVGEVKVEGSRALIRLESVDDRSAAEQFRGTLLFVDSSEAAPPPKGEYYIHDLIGCEVRTTAGAVVGRIDDVLETGGQQLWAVRNGDSLVHIPAVRDFVVSVDTANKEITVELPDGLLEQQG